MNEKKELAAVPQRPANELVLSLLPHDKLRKPSALSKKIAMMHERDSLSRTSRFFNADELTKLQKESVRPLFAIDGEAIFQLSELRRNLTYLSNRLLLEIGVGKYEKRYEINRMKRTIKNSLVYTREFQSILSLADPIKKPEKVPFTQVSDLSPLKRGTTLRKKSSVQRLSV